MEEIRNFNQWTLARSAQIYEELLGVDWISNQLAQREADLQDDKYAILAYRLEHHPVIAFWPWGASESWRVNKEKMVPYYQILRFGAPAFHMNLAKRLPGFRLRGTKERLRNQTDFESFAFECKIASMYHLTGYQIEFLPESYKRTPDFVIKCRGGNVFAECKIREFTKEWREYNKKASRVAASLLRLMDQAKTNLSVFIESPDALQSLNERELSLELTVDLFRRSNSGSFLVGVSNISWKDYRDFGVAKQGAYAPELDPRAQLAFDGTETRITNGRAVYLNPRIVGFKTTKAFDRASPLLGRFRNALGQIAKHPPSVLYLEVEEGSSAEVENFYVDKDILAMLDPSKPTYESQTASLVTI